MLGVALIFFREVLEAALIVGIMAAATREVAGRSRWILAGLGAGLAGACLLAVFAERLASAAAGMGQELFNAGVLLTAVAMLGWHTLWMARHGRELARTTGNIGADVAAGRRPLYAVAVVIGLAVLREGSEVVLFLSGLLASGTTDNRSLLLGAAAGISTGLLVGVGLARGLRIIPMRHLFSVTTVLLALLAAGMAARAVAFLCQAGYFSEFTQTAWDTSAWAADGSALGQVLNALIGYTAVPMVIQVAAYAATLGLLTVAAALSRAPTPGAPARLGLPEEESQATGTLAMNVETDEQEGTAPHRREMRGIGGLTGALGSVGVGDAMDPEVLEVLVEPGQLIEGEAGQDLGIAHSERAAGRQDLANPLAGLVQQDDGNSIAGRLVPKRLDSSGEDRISSAAREVLQVHRQLGVNDVKAPGFPGAHCILQARQGETVFHFLPWPVATCG